MTGTELIKWLTSEQYYWECVLEELQKESTDMITGKDDGWMRDYYWTIGRIDSIIHIREEIIKLFMRTK